MSVEWNGNKLHKVHKELGEMTKVFQGFRKKGWSQTLVQESSRKPLKN